MLVTHLLEVKNVLLPMKLVGSLSNQVAYLVRIVAMKDKILYTVRISLGYTHKELEFLHSHTALLTQ